MGATLKDIARLAGCSHTLVSGVLQGNPSCRASREMRKKILKLSCELDYRPNRLARRLRGIRSKVVFVLSRFRPAPEHSLMISAIQEKMYECGHQVFQAQTTSPEHTLELLGEFSEFGYDGVISCCTHYIPPPALDIPQVVISALDAIPHDMGIDDEQNAYTVTHHLLEHGRRRIAFAGIGNWSCGEMHRGYSAALAGYDIAVNENWKIDLHFDITGLQRILKLIENDNIDGIVCSEDHLAGKVISALNQHDIRIPEDVAVISSGSGKSFAEFTSVPLTTLLMPWRQLGAEAALLLLSRIDKKEYPHKLPRMFAGEIIPGASCGCGQKEIRQLYTISPSTSLKETILAEKSLHLE